jgi:hypothetical protein
VLPSLASGHTDITSKLLRVLQELGDVSAALERSLADWQLDSAEGRGLLQKMREFLEAVIALQAVISEASKEAVMTRPTPARMGLPVAVQPARRARA